MKCSHLTSFILCRIADLELHLCTGLCQKLYWTKSTGLGMQRVLKDKEALRLLHEYFAPKTTGLRASFISFDEYHKAHSGCHADSDGDCDWPLCPQKRDGEPAKTGRHCPLDK